MTIDEFSLKSLRFKTADKESSQDPDRNTLSH